MNLRRLFSGWTIAAAASAVAVLLVVDGRASSVPVQAPASPTYVSIFNGRDLTGWHVDRVAADDGLAAKLFTIDNGELVLDTPGTQRFAWLTYDRPLTDFALRLKFVAYRDAVGNCGIQFRDEWMNDEYPRHGFDLASNVPESTGFIWDFRDQWLPYPMKGYQASNFKPYLPEGWTYKWSTDPDPWNDFEVSAVGSRVKTVLNGKTIIDWDGGDTIRPSGHIAIEVHQRQTFKFRFKDIELADLTR
jgi:hypothetical protein